MLLRSSSTPLLNSGISQYCKVSFPGPEPVLPMLHRSRSFSAIKKMRRAPLETDPQVLKKKPSPESTSMDGLLSTVVVDEVGLNDRLLFLSNSELKSEEAGKDEFQRDMLTEVMMGAGSGSGGGRIRCGGGGGGDENGESDSEYGDFDHRCSSTDLYYKKMIEANPGNPLLLSNYARYLKEVRADFVKAEEYCGRAVTAACSDDGEILTLYAELLWQTRKDPILANNYFDQAVKAAPEDCYVLASYANFLWDSEEETTDADRSSQHNNSSFGTPPPPTIAAS